MPFLESFEFLLAAGSYEDGHTSYSIAPSALLVRDCFEGVHVEVDPACGLLLAGNALVSRSVNGGFSLRLEIYIEPLAVIRFFCRRQGLSSLLVLLPELLVLLAPLCLDARWHIVPILTPTICVSIDL